MSINAGEGRTIDEINTSLHKGRYVLQVAGCRLQVEKWTFKSG